MPLRIGLSAVLLLFAAAAVFADTINQFQVDPPRPSTRDEVELLLRGSWGSGCPPTLAFTRVTPGTIEVTFEQELNNACAFFFVDWGTRVRLGRLPAGTYDVIFSGLGNDVPHQSLTVEDRTFHVSPSFGSAGTEVVIEGIHYTKSCVTNCDPQITFGGVAATNVRRRSLTQSSATVPAHAAGRVDVVATTHEGTTLTAHDGFQYTLPGIDISGELERVFFPLNFEGSGAAGSLWHTENIVYNGSPIAVTIGPSLAEPPIASGQRVTTQTDNRDGGAFVYIPRGLESMFTFTSSIDDRSRVADDLGTEMPIVRRADTAASLRFRSVRVVPGYRMMLRIYDFDAQFSRPVRVHVTSPSSTQVVTINRNLDQGIVCVTVPCLQPRPTFVAIDLTPSLASFSGQPIVDVTISAVDDGSARLWGLITVTNNETQHVTTYRSAPL